MLKLWALGVTRWTFMPRQSCSPPARFFAGVFTLGRSRDLRAAIDHWTRVLQVGPFVLFEHADHGDVRYRGKPTRIDASTAMAWSGDLQIELIEQHNGAASCYRDFLHSGRTGLHPGRLR